MRNIRKPVVRILLNTLSHSKVGLYNDYNSAKKVLVFKEHGIQIVGQPSNGSKASPADPVIGSSGLATGLSVAKSSTLSGENQLMLVKFTPPGPCELCDWTYSLSIREKIRYPGVHSNRTNVQEISYGGTTPAVTLTGAAVNDTFVEAAEADIITQISQNTGLHIAEQRYPMKMTGSAVEARRAYRVLIDTGDDAAITIKDSNGDVIDTVTLDSTAKLSAEIINADTDVNDVVFAFATGVTNEIMIMGAANGFVFTVIDGSGTGTAVVGDRYIALLSKEKDVQFDAIPARNMGAVMARASLYTLSGATAAGTTNLFVDGVEAEAATDAASAATYSTNINTKLADGTAITSITATGHESLNRVFLYGDDDLKVVKFVFSAASTASLLYAWSGYPSYPQLTRDDIFRIFYNIKDGGVLSAMQYSEQPLEGVDYNVYYIKNENLKITSLHGAGYNQTGEVEYEIYVPTSVATTDYWDAVISGSTGYSLMIAPTTADTHFEELLGILTGLAVTSW